jgi:hypothetical protein
MVRSHHLWFWLLLLLRDVAWGRGVLQCGYCTDLGCNARVSVYFRCSCPMRDSSLLSIHHQCLSSMSVTYSCDFYFMESAEGWNLKQSNNPRTQGMLPTHPLKKKIKRLLSVSKTSDVRRTCLLCVTRACRRRKHLPTPSLLTVTKT